MMKTIQEILNRSAEYLKEKQVHHPKREAEELIAEALEMKRLDLYVNFDKPLAEKELEKIRVYLSRRSKGEPIQYIHGRVQFFDCVFDLSSDVLIPRQETELLVAKIAESIAESDLDCMFLWDVCCGSGCIGVSLKKKFPKLQVSLSDISEPALSMAKKNALKNHVDVEFFLGDLLEPFHGRKVDLFVCNPPYISKKEYIGLEREVKEYEPKIALVAGETGIEFYERLAKDLPQYLNRRAKVWFEIGYLQEERLTKLFNQPFWRQKKVEKDLAGHPRFFFLENE